MNRSIILLLLSAFLMAQTFECNTPQSEWYEKTCEKTLRQFNTSNWDEAVKECDVFLNCETQLAPCDPTRTPNYLAGIEAACRSIEFSGYEFQDCMAKIDNAENSGCVSEHFEEMESIDTVKPAKCALLRNSGCVRKEVKKYCTMKDLVSWQKYADDQFNTLNC